MNSETKSDVVLLESNFRLLLQSLKSKIANRGVVERFIAPVLKTGEPLRVPGVRIPPPLLNKRKSLEINLKAFFMVIFRPKIN